MSPPRSLKIAIAALGGQGGGVLADWIVALGEANGYIAQSTSVPGVAQRTGATIYYVELFPAEAARAAGRDPVLALMPSRGDVDVVLASELMEAGRAMLRGLVTPDRTALIASSHRIHTIAEKSAMGDGVASAGEVIAAARARARTLVLFDMQEAGDRAGSAISAVLFGALAGARVLPFTKDAFEAVIVAGGLAVAANRAGFAAGFSGAEGGVAPEPAPARSKPPAPGALAERIAREFDAPLQPLLLEGARRLADYQDRAYAGAYLDQIASLARAGAGAEVLEAAARHLALWMSIEDTIRVADLKIRDSRFARVRAEVRAEAGQIVAVSEYMHPRWREVCETMPAWLGRALLGSRLAGRAFGPLFRKGRRIHTTRLGGFLTLWITASLRPIRRWTLRHELERARIADWLSRIADACPRDPDLALAITQAQRLIKGYSDTYERGLANFERILAEIDARPDITGARVRRLIAAALADDQGAALKALLRSEPLPAAVPA